MDGTAGCVYNDNCGNLAGRKAGERVEFNSMDFLLFFPLVSLLYFLLPQKVKWVWLLACSVYFYMCWRARYILLIGFSIAVTYAGALLIERLHKKGRRGPANWVLAAVLASNFAVLFLFKYYGFFSSVLAGASGGRLALPVLQLALPVGISFYTFQALGYAIDVYRGDLPPERNPFRYALFVTFFPQLVAGPIERATNLLPQFYQRHPFDYDRMKSGLVRMGWGFFLKVVIADRLAVLVDQVYSQAAEAPGWALALATVCFAFQIYCDFASYSTIAIGAAEVLGFRLMQNFNAPYLALSVKDFWRRWHISLSTWFKDYLYIPLGGSRRGTARTCLNLMAVFLVSGLWHGAAMTFVVWGGLHGLFQAAGVLWGRLRGPAGAKPLPAPLAWAGTFALVNLAWVFFRAEDIGQALTVLRRIFTAWGGALPGGLGLDAPDMAVGAAALALLFFADIRGQKKDLHGAVLALPLAAQWALYLGLIAAILLFGVYGPGYTTAPFIYFQF